MAQLHKCDACNFAGGGILEECEGSSLLASQFEFITKNTTFLLTSLVFGYLFLLNAVFLTGLMGDYKSHHPRHLSLLLLHPTYWPRKSVVDTIDFSVRFIQHLFYVWHPPARSNKNSVPTSLCQRNMAVYKKVYILKWGVGKKHESCLEQFTDVIGLIKMYVSFSDKAAENTSANLMWVLPLEITPLQPQPSPPPTASTTAPTKRYGANDRTYVYPVKLYSGSVLIIGPMLLSICPSWNPFSFTPDSILVSN